MYIFLLFEPTKPRLTSASQNFYLKNVCHEGQEEDPHIMILKKLQNH